MQNGFSKSDEEGKEDVMISLEGMYDLHMPRVLDPEEEIYCLGAQ